MCEKHYRRMVRRGTTETPRRPIFSRHAIDDRGCWIWQGPLYPNGYGKTSRKVHGTTLAHRAYYTEYRGPVCDGLDLDHLCRNRACVNPDHLEPVARSENLNRGHASRTRCENGLHDITAPGALRPGTFQCVACWRIRYRKAGARYRAKRKAGR